MKNFENLQIKNNRTLLKNSIYNDLLQIYFISFSMKNLPQHRPGFALVDFSSLTLLSSFSLKSHDKRTF